MIGVIITRNEERGLKGENETENERRKKEKKNYNDRGAGNIETKKKLLSTPNKKKSCEMETGKM